MGRAAEASRVQRAVAAEPARAAASLPQRWWGKLLLVLASIGLLSLAFAPFNQFYLAWVALVPWLVVVAHCRSARTAFFWSWLAGAAFFTTNMWWLVFVTGPGMAALMAVLGLYWGMAGGIIRGAGLLEPRSPAKAVGSIFLIAAVWVGFEWFHGIWPLEGLAWGYLGQSQTPALALCQIADITGVYGVSFFVAMMNALAALVALRLLRRGRFSDHGFSGPVKDMAAEEITPMGFRQLVPALIATFLVGVGIVIYGFFRLRQHPTVAGPRVLVVQPNFPQSNSGAKGASPEETLDFHIRATREGLRKSPNVDLVVWSETMMPPINQSSRDFARAHHFEVNWDEANDQVVQIARDFNTNLLVGGDYWDQWGIKGDHYMAADRRNSAYLYTPSGMSDLRYDKIHLVPFGETMPFKSSIPPLYAFFLSLSPYSEEFTLTAGPPDAMTVFQMRQGWRFVTPICFEDMDGPLLHRMLKPRDDRKRADFIVNITNDGWFKFNEMPQHLENAVFRSIENRVPTARSVNTGISGFIDSSGRMSGLIGPGKEGVSVETMMLDSRVTFYSRFGDVFAYLCAAASAVLLAMTLVRWWRT